MPSDSSEKSSTARLWALIPCAGTGARAGSEGPKQYQPIAGLPLVGHTLAAFERVSRLSAIAVVLAPGDVLFAQQRPQCAGRVLSAYCGGATRAQSVLNGLRWLQQHGAAHDDWILVHDAARCLVTPEQINHLIDACSAHPVGGLLAHPLADTLKRECLGAPARVAATEPRQGLWLAQTPQMFRLGALIQALLQAGTQVTDESSAMESAGHQPLLVTGSATNFKVTYAQDFALAQAVLAQRGETPSQEQPT